MNVAHLSSLAKFLVEPVVNEEDHSARRRGSCEGHTKTRIEPSYALGTVHALEGLKECWSGYARSSRSKFLLGLKGRFDRVGGKEGHVVRNPCTRASNS